MEQMNMAAKQVIAFNKAAIGNGFNMMAFMQDQAERMVNNFIAQAPWIPEEGKRALTELGEAYKKGRDELKKAVDEGFERLEGLVGGKTESV